MKNSRLQRVSLLLLMALPLSRAPAEIPAAADDAAKVLAAHLNALKDTQTLEARFICEKRLALLETPLLSRGQVWIQKGDPREGEGAVRFSTEKPYISELILAQGKVIARSQHETQWTKTNQSGRPGLTAIMGQLGGWSTGEAGKLTQHYTIAASAQAVPPIPPASAAATQPAKADADTFTLTPINKDLTKAVKRVTVAIDRASHHLLFIEILTQQDDATRYWFYDVQNNAKLPADIFNPSTSPTPAAPPAPASAPAGDKP